MMTMTMSSTMTLSNLLKKYRLNNLIKKLTIGNDDDDYDDDDYDDDAYDDDGDDTYGDAGIDNNCD